MYLYLYFDGIQDTNMATKYFNTCQIFFSCKFNKFKALLIKPASTILAAASGAICAAQVA